MKNRLILVCCAALMFTAAPSVWTAAPATATAYYVSNTGNDDNPGTSPAMPWQSITRVNTASIEPGDTVHFKRGDAWRDQLIPHSGSTQGHVTYTAYGKGDKPRLLGSLEKNNTADWMDEGGNIWRLDTAAGEILFDVGNIIFDGEQAVGVKVWQASDLDQQGEFWYDEMNGDLKLFSISNPAVRYTDIECALTRDIVNEENRHYVIYQNLALKYGGAHGIGGGQTHHIIVRACDVSYIGGGELYLPPYEEIRYGNGIEFWADAHDNLVEGCRLWEIYDAALSNQNHEPSMTQFNIRYRNNLIWNSEYSFEYWNRGTGSTTSGISFENNTCADAGGGWGHTQRPTQLGLHLAFFDSPGETSDFQIKNNIFYRTTNHGFWLSSDFNGFENLHLDYNCWFQESGFLIQYQGEFYTMAEFAAYQVDTGQDIHSLATDPLFTGMTGTNLIMTGRSPIMTGASPVGAAGYYLSQTAAGEPVTSPCVDSADPTGPTTRTTTRTDGVQDSGIADMGYHYPVRLVIAGPGPAYDNPPYVRVFPRRQDAIHEIEFNAYGAPHYGVQVACGNLDGGFADEILTGAGPGAGFGPHVRAFNMDGTSLPAVSFLAYGTNRWGVNVCAGDLDGDGYDEIVTGAGPGAVFGPHVRAFDYDGSSPVVPVNGVSFFAYGTLKWGVNVCAGDLDGEGYDEIITGAGPGAVFGPHVRGWNVDGSTAVAMPGVSFLAYGTNRYGVQVASGDVDGDGMDEIITAPGPSSSFSAHIRGWNFDGIEITSLDGFSFFAWTAAQSRYGARIFAGADLDGDGRDEILAGPGPDPSTTAPVKVFLYDGSQIIELYSFNAFPAGSTHGTTVAAGRF